VRVPASSYVASFTLALDRGMDAVAQGAAPAAGAGAPGGLAAQGDPSSIAKELRTHSEQVPEAPTLRRYKTNDSTVEKLGELLRENPAGLLVRTAGCRKAGRLAQRRGGDGDGGKGGRSKRTGMAGAIPGGQTEHGRASPADGHSAAAFGSRSGSGEAG
jgi:hypothetical protein